MNSKQTPVACENCSGLQVIKDCQSKRKIAPHHKAKRKTGPHCKAKIAPHCGLYPNSVMALLTVIAFLQYTLFIRVFSHLPTRIPLLALCHWL